MRLTSINKIFIFNALCAALLFLCSCSQQQSPRVSESNDEVIVRADVTLKPTLLEVAENYSYVTNFQMMLQFAPSALLLSEPAVDSVAVFIFANDHYIEEARSLNLVDSVAEIVLAHAVPSLIVPRFNPYMITNLSDLKNSRLRIGIADPQSDILGAFALEILKKNYLFDLIEPRLILAGPSALDLADCVARSELDVGIAWTMSARWNPESFDVVLLVPNEIPRVAAICAVRACTPIDSAAADRLMTYLNSDRCQNIFRNWGYLTTESDIDMYAPAAIIGGKPPY